MAGRGQRLVFSLRTFCDKFEAGKAAISKLYIDEQDELLSYINLHRAMNIITFIQTHR